jgi:MSHA biogenesis protein MshK
VLHIIINKQYPLRFVLVSGLACFMGSMANAQTLRDPTLPASSVLGQSSPEKASGLVLHSIIKGQQSYVIINDQILKLGGKIQGLTIINISHRDVTLSDGRKLTLFKSVTE